MGAYDNLEEWMAKNMGPSVGAPSSTYRDTVRSELAALIAAVEGGPVSLTERDSDPDDPTEGQSVIWQSDGTGLGSDGDVLLKATAGGTTIETVVNNAIAVPVVSGGYNHTEIQAALNTGKPVILDGAYNTRVPLTIPNTSALIGMPGTTITYYPSPDTASSDYMITCTGNQRKFPALQNITLNTRGKCRGVHYDKQYYSPLWENLRVNTYYEVGVDVTDCWACTAGSLYLGSGTGLGVRCWANNGTYINFIHATACDNDNFPAADEELIQDLAESYVQTAEARRALVVLASNCHGTRIGTLVLESNTFAGDPLVSADGSTCCIDYLYIEGNDSTEAAVEVVGDGDRQGAIFRICGGEAITSTTTKCLVDLTGTTRKVLVENFLSLDTIGLADSVIRCTSGTHYNPQVRNCRVTGVVDIQNVAATITYDAPGQAIPTMADTAAPNNCIYYSTTQSALAYKDSGGTVVTIDTTGI